MPNLAGYKLGPDGYLEHLRSAEAKPLKVPIIASLNGTSTGGWVGYAEENGRSRRRCLGAEYLLHSD